VSQEAGPKARTPIKHGRLLTVRSPYQSADGGPGEELLAVPALNLDAALVHLNRADERRSWTAAA
jgi:glutaconate CoA-transferase subunit A